MGPGNGENEFRKFLLAISDQLSISDVGSMKFVCYEKLGARVLDGVGNGKPHEFLELLEERDLIRPTDLSYLKDIFLSIQRSDLAKIIPVSERKIGDDVDSGTCIPPPSPGISDYSILLKGVADELAQDDVSSMKYLLNIPKGKRSKIDDGESLLDFMKKEDMVCEENLDKLKEVLTGIHRKDLVKKINNFISNRDNSLPSPPPPSQQPSQQPPPPPSLLMKPSDFGRPASQTSPPQYSMKQKPFGYALLINNEAFTGKTKEGLVLNERLGTEKDLTNLKDLWEKLGFVVEHHTNLKAHRMVTVVQDMASKINKDSNIEHSCFVCCILSHGKDGSIYGEDSKEVQVADLIGFFKETNCEALIEKPKLFFIQACRGQKKLTTISAGSQQETGDTDAAPSIAENEERFRQSNDLNDYDFLMGYSTLPGFVSFRSMQYGSWYITALVEVFSEYYKKEDLMTMMIRVNGKVSEAYTKQCYKQCPAPVITLKKRLFFLPK